MQFARNFPDQLRAQITTSDVVGKRVVLNRKGKEYSGLCPFHHEKSASFTVNDQKGFFHCFGCAAHGDVIGFTMQIDGLNFKDAVLKLASDYSIFVPIIENEKQDQEQQDKTTRAFLLLQTACQFFANNLFSNNGNQALQYLYQRGLNNSQIKRFNLGFALDNYQSLQTHLIAQGFSQSELLESGIISQNNNGIYDKFRNRIIFPISNPQGQIIAFGGRIMGDGQPKYLNSSETELFKKGHNLYNFSSAKKAIYDQKFAVLVEGYMDVIALVINGIENVVAPLGTAITIDQLQLLFKTTEDLVICLDGDKAGINAMQRAIDLALPIINSKNLVRFAFLPKGLDPDDFVRKNGKIATQQILKNAPNLSQTLFDFEANNLNINQADNQISPEKKAQLEAKLSQKVNLINDHNSKKYFNQFYKNLLFGLGRGKKILTQKKPIQAIATPDNFNKQDKYSLAIIALLIRFPNLKDYQDEFCILRDLEFKNQNLANIKDQLIDFLDKNNNINQVDIKIELDKLIVDNNIKKQIFTLKFIGQNLDKAQQQLQIFLLQYFYEEVSEQYQQILALTDEFDSDFIVNQAEKQKQLFDYKTQLEKKILLLISDLI